MLAVIAQAPMGNPEMISLECLQSRDAQALAAG